MDNPEFGCPDFNDSQYLEFTSTTVSGELTANEYYRISTDADVILGFGEDNDEGFTLSNGAFLGADQSFVVKTSDNSKWLHAVAHITTTSGVVTANRLK